MLTRRFWCSLLSSIYSHGLVNLLPIFEYRASNQNLCQILSTLTALPEAEFRIAISESGLLMTSGLIGFSRNCRDLEDKFDLIDSFSNILLTPHETVDDLICRFLKRSSAPTITLDHFPHLAADSEILRPYLKNALSDKTTGVNVLLHGRQGSERLNMLKLWRLS